MPGLRRTLRALALETFRRLPARLRRLVVTLGTPGYTVGAVCVLTAGDRVLLLRQRHRPDWSLPGGLLARGEEPAAAVVREVREETGLSLEPGLPVTTVVHPHLRRVDMVYRVEVAAPLDVRPRGEARRAEWLRLTDLGVADEQTVELLRATAAAVAPGGTAGRLRR